MSEEKRQYIFFIKDILTSIEKIERYTGNLSYDEFCKNDMVADAVMRNLEIIGEAVKKVPEEIKDKYQDVEWREAAGFRDILIHDYFGIDIEAVWETICDNLPSFKSEIKSVLNSEKSAEENLNNN